MTSTDDTPGPNDLHRTDDRTALLLVDDRALVYDLGNPSAWIESDESVALADCR